MAELQYKHLTYADVLETEDNNRYELYEGRLVCMSPAPKAHHQLVVTELSGELRTCLRDVIGRVIVAPFDIRLFASPEDSPEDIDTVLEPDILVLCDPSRIDDRGLAGAPDLVVEVLSDSSRQSDRIIKYDLYERAGVPEYWIVDPDTKTISVFGLDGRRYHPRSSYSVHDAIPFRLCGADCLIDLAVVFAGI